MKNEFYHYAPRVKRMTASIIREILKISSRPGLISFAGGLPSPDSFPLKEFERAVRDTVRLDGIRALQYTLTDGILPLRNYLCRWLSKQEIVVEPPNMLLTHGSQQALDLLGKIFLAPGDSVLVENPSYLGAIQCFNGYEAKYVTVPIDDRGLRIDKAEEKLKSHKVKFIYVVPTFHNPAGTTMDVPRRLNLIKLAKKIDVPIVEDDPYSLIRFKGNWVPSIYSLAKGKGVIYLSTFSKLLSPGIRLGYVLAEKEIIAKLVLAKQAADLQTNTFIQYAVYHYCQHGYLEKHIPTIIRDYAHKAGLMLAAMEEFFPKEVKWFEPQGGMFVWTILPEGLKASRVFQKSIEQNVAFVDGSVFFANGGGENTMRLNFTNSSDSDLRLGISRLGKVIKSFL